MLSKNPSTHSISHRMSSSLLFLPVTLFILIFITRLCLLKVVYRLSVNRPVCFQTNFLSPLQNSKILAFSPCLWNRRDDNRRACFQLSSNGENISRHKTNTERSSNGEINQNLLWGWDENVLVFLPFLWSWRGLDMMSWHSARRPTPKNSLSFGTFILEWTNTI